tara:strand:+ start:1128 stop:2219 length:1092 start_codon:yes stop_codon:yes gene_type:complete
MWKTVKLGDMLDVQNGYAFNSKQFDADGDIPLIRIRDLKNSIDTKTRYTGEYDDKYVVQSGDLLIGMDGEFRCYEWQGAAALLNQRVCRLQNFHADLNQRFLLYAINGELKKIEDVTGFTTVKHLSSKTIKQIELPLPPLAEQERIVAKLDAAFAEIDEVISEVEAKENEVQKLKASLLSSSLNSDAVTWSTAKLGEICILNYGKGLDKKDRSENAVIPVYGANGIKAYTDKLLHDKPSIIIGRKGSAGELNKVTKPFWALDVTYYVTTDESIVDIDFLFYALATLNLPSMARGIKPGINRNDVYNKSIKLPPLAEQERIVTKLDAANSEFKNANEAIIKSKANYLALKSAILAKELQSSEAA